MNYTIRPNTAGRGWEQLAARSDIPRTVDEVRVSGRPKIVDQRTADEVESWMAACGWELHEAPVFIEQLG